MRGVSRLSAIVLLLASVMMPVQAENQAMLTGRSGVVLKDGKRLNLLQYVQVGNTVDVESDSEAVFSSCRRGERFVLNGPCKVVFRKSGPEMARGSGSLKRQTFEDRRRMVPSELSVTYVGCTFFRGEPRLHLSGNLLPEEQAVDFTPVDFESFHPLAFDSEGASYEFTDFRDGSFFIPDGVLKAGQEYEFILEASSGAGSSVTSEQVDVAVLSDSDSQLIWQAIKQRETDSTQAARLELLAYYLKYDLLTRALRLLSSHPSFAENDDNLGQIESNLRERLYYPQPD